MWDTNFKNKNPQACRDPFRRTSGIEGVAIEFTRDTRHFPMGGDLAAWAIECLGGMDRRGPLIPRKNPSYWGIPEAEAGTTVNS